MGAGCSTGAGSAGTLAPQARGHPRGLNKLASMGRTGDIRQYYDFIKVLDRGSLGVIHLVRLKDGGKQYACKSVPKAKVSAPDEMQALLREVQILRHVTGHPHVVELVDVFVDRQDVHMVMELCEGGELFQRISTRRGRFTEEQAAVIMSGVASMLVHCHAMNVMHRDIKPENFLLASADPNDFSTLKAIDFGASTYFKEGEVLSEVVGSPHYVAPEVLSGEYGPAADVWSAGVMLYVLLAGHAPFDGAKDELIYKRILSSPLDIRSGAWSSVSSEAKDLVRKMLARDPRRRATPQQVLDHPWVVLYAGQAAVATDNQVPEMLQRMRAFTQYSDLKKAALKVCARLVPDQELAGMAEVFRSIDKDGSGSITVGELCTALRKRGAKGLGVAEVNQMLKSMDMGGDLKLQYDEFIAATLAGPKVLERGEVLVRAFSVFDKDGNGQITKEEVEAALRENGLLHDVRVDPSDPSPQPQGVGLTQQEFSALLEGVDTDHDGNINFTEFCAMMLAAEVPSSNTKRRQELVKIASEVGSGMHASAARAVLAAEQGAASSLVTSFQDAEIADSSSAANKPAPPPAPLTTQTSLGALGGAPSGMGSRQSSGRMVALSRFSHSGSDGSPQVSEGGQALPHHKPPGGGNAKGPGELRGPGDGGGGAVTIIGKDRESPKSVLGALTRLDSGRSSEITEAHSPRSSAGRASGGRRMAAVAEVV